MSGARRHRLLAAVLGAALAAVPLGGVHAGGAPEGESAPAKAKRRDSSAPMPGRATAPPLTEQQRPPEPARQLAADEVVPILGRKIVGASNEELGRVVNVLVDDLGRTRALVIDFGGFLGVGSRKIAVDWGQLVFNPGSPDRQIGLKMTREQIQGAREFKENVPKPVDVATPPPDDTPADRGGGSRDGKKAR